MGQRHNRRRTRPRSRNRSADLSPVELPPYPVSHLHHETTPAACDSLNPISVPFAPTWHHGYTTWQKRDRTLRLEVEQCRLFGGEPGDDVGLCYRMLEYFGGLDYIDSSQSPRLLPG
ncbi:hypothetical protein BDV26DRAFT_128009 [Aspergillus bertholletiae]|uniref:Uncharacterized protein n=1 Tax=Aspergillus bertholletiae TaxID=1226010 RepID=A0A5N7BFU5_9EURO|nr:hypothetical protein BDV26DRAFT_128009 [Aspergillus bertholletiae]